MTFSMSELNRTTKLLIETDEEDPDAAPQKSAKEIEEEKKAEKDAQQKMVSLIFSHLPLFFLHNFPQTFSYLQSLWLEEKKAEKDAEQKMVSFFHIFFSFSAKNGFPSFAFFLILRNKWLPSLDIRYAQLGAFPF